jgi:hypothetical protein
LKAKGIETKEEGGLESKGGPDGFVVTDPDGNEILFDQHV